MNANLDIFSFGSKCSIPTVLENVGSGLKLIKKLCLSVCVTASFQAATGTRHGEVANRCSRMKPHWLLSLMADWRARIGSGVDVEQKAS